MARTPKKVSANPQQKAGVKQRVPVSSISRQRTEDFKAYYVNNASLATAYYDVSIVFSEIQTGVNDMPLIAEKCRVVMNPAHAKALVIVLDASMKQWEGQHGVIQLPEGMVSPSILKVSSSGR